MKHISKLVGEQLPTHSTTTSERELIPVEKEIVKRFYASIKALYGVSRYSANWETDEDERASMRLWAHDIIKFSRAELNQKLLYAKSMMHQAEWRHPDIAMILNGNRQTSGAAGQAAMSYRPASEVLPSARPALTDGRKAAGQAALDALRDSLATNNEVTAAAELRAEHAERNRRADTVLDRDGYSHAIRGRQFPESDDMEERLEDLRKR